MLLGVNHDFGYVLLNIEGWNPHEDDWRGAPTAGVILFQCLGGQIEIDALIKCGKLNFFCSVDLSLKLYYAGLEGQQGIAENFLQC
jgi:hypothetical protein